jgi:glycosyltransferase involved in cell wall biosynthesis
VLPHGRMSEIFNVTLLQAINCGTIPLLMNDVDANFDYTWCDWANGFVVPFNQERGMLSAMRQLQNEPNDYTYMSTNIASKIQDKFSYFSFKNKFQQLLKGN